MYLFQDSKYSLVIVYDRDWPALKIPLSVSYERFEYCLGHFSRQLSLSVFAKTAHLTKSVDNSSSVSKQAVLSQI